MRIKAKHARYAAELAARRRGARLAALAEALRDLQDAIGAHQDAVVAERRVRALANQDSALAVGRIVELERLRRREARARVPELWKRIRARPSRPSRRRGARPRRRPRSGRLARWPSSSITAPSRTPPRVDPQRHAEPLAQHLEDDRARRQRAHPLAVDAVVLDDLRRRACRRGSRPGWSSSPAPSLTPDDVAQRAGAAADRERDLGRRRA